MVECNWLSFLPWHRYPKLPSTHMPVSEPSFFLGACSREPHVPLHQPFAQGQGWWLSPTQYCSSLALPPLAWVGESRLWSDINVLPISFPMLLGAAQDVSGIQWCSMPSLCSIWFCAAFGEGWVLWHPWHQALKWGFPVLSTRYSPLFRSTPVGIPVGSKRIAENLGRKGCVCETGAFENQTLNVQVA